jgi:hypothetical protein
MVLIKETLEFLNVWNYVLHAEACSFSRFPPATKTISRKLLTSLKMGDKYKNIEVYI